MIGWIIGIVVVLLIVCWVIGTYNGLIKGRIVVDEAFATMDVYLKKRYDLIPNLVETVKGYASHEKETLEKVISLRTGSYDAMTPEEKIQNGAQISKMIPQIMAVAEQYPDLKANQNFMDLSHNLNETEDDIANARKYYNGAVKQYNMKVQMFPGSLIAGLFHFETKKMFEVENAVERQNVQVKFWWWRAFGEKESFLALCCLPGFC